MNINNLIKRINNKYFNNIFGGSLELFDVSLRDGLQSKKKIYSLKEKKVLLHEIINKYNPTSIEVGSIVSNKVLPQMNNSIELYKYAMSLNNDINYYLLIPNINKLQIALNNNVKHMSFISSFSNSFQEKNINKTLKETKEEIKKIDSILYNNNLCNNKLYLSCFNNCPIEKVIDNDTILFHLLDYTELKAFNEICLSDTTGNLDYDDFKRLMYDIQKIININKLSLHLHVDKDNVENTLKIIEEAFKFEICKLDISCIEDGGCSVTMDKDKLKSNLSYKILSKLI